jgi:predicted RNA binding protein YcfA (HicA-like mRNA interferase family)
VARRIGPMPSRKLDKVPRRHGFVPIRQRGSHVFYQHPDGRSTTSVNHPGRDIPPGLVRKILADAHLDAEALDE